MLAFTSVPNLPIEALKILFAEFGTMNQYLASA
jgi:hypothetical protein